MRVETKGSWKSKIASTAVILGLCTILAKLSSFARDIVLSFAYGAGSTSDAYLVAASIPTVLFTGILTAIYTSYIPMYHEIRVEDKEKINKYTSNVLNAVMVLAALVVIIFLLFRNEVVYLFAAGFEDETFNLTVTLSSISIFAILFMSVLYVLQGFLQANNRFYLVAVFMVPVNLIIAVGIGMSYYYSNKLLMAGAIVVAYALVIPVFWLQSRKSGFRYIPYLNVKDTYLQKTILAVLPIFAGQMLAEINNIVDKNMASRLPSGYVTALDYGFKVAAMVYGILAWPIATMIYPKLSAYLSEGKGDEAKATVRKSMELIGVIIIPVTLIVAVLAKPIIELFFYRGAFTEESVNITAQALAVYVISAIPIGYRTVLEKAYYAMRETKKTVIFSTLGIIVNIVLDILLLTTWRHIGLAFATTCSCFVTTFCYIFWLSKNKMPGLFDRKFLLSLIQTIISAAVMLAVLLKVKDIFYQGIIGSMGKVFWCLILMGGISVIVYALAWGILEAVKKRLHV